MARTPAPARKSKDCFQLHWSDSAGRGNGGGVSLKFNLSKTNTTPLTAPTHTRWLASAREHLLLLWPAKLDSTVGAKVESAKERHEQVAAS